MKKIKVNMHLTEACNYKCKHCFAKFEDHINLDEEQWKQIIDNVVSSGLVHEINFAGGEPTLLPYLPELAEYVNSKGLTCTLITNGSRMDDVWIRKNAGFFRTIGISVDSFSDEISTAIGRCDCHGNVQSAEKISNIIFKIKYYHPEVKIKLNTVVNALNKNEILALFLKRNNIPVDRWKILKMSYFNDGCHENSALVISDYEYDKFIRNNLSVLGISDVSYVRNNAERFELKNGMEIIAEKELKGSYFMIDAGGYIVDDTSNDSYRRVGERLTDMSFIEALSDLPINLDVYNARYKIA